MERRPEFFQPTEDERRTIADAARSPENVMSQLSAAQLHFELADWPACLAAIDTGLTKAEKSSAPTRAQLYYVRGRVLLCMHDDAGAEAALAEAIRENNGDNRKLGLDIQLAQARREMHRRDYTRALSLYAEVLKLDPKGPRGGAARYYTGLCLWRMDKKDAAKATWRAHKTEMPWDRLARRSAASLGVPESDAFTNQELFEEDGWW